MEKSAAGEAIHTPSIPPMTNIAMKPSAKSIGGSKLSFPFHSVNSQQRTSTPVGTEISSVVTEKNESLTRPVVYMWWPHTVNDSAMMSIRARITNRYPYSGFRLNTGTISDTIPQAPMMSM